MKQTAAATNTRQLPIGIDVRETDRLDYWCRTFGVTRQQLCTAVASVGSNSDLVRRHLRTGDKVFR